MGAWGTNSFENDDAMDFVSEIESVSDIKGALVAMGDDYVEVDTGSRVIVAAECVAAMRGHASPAMPEELEAKVQKFGKCPLELYADARENLSAVMREGELSELWAEEGSGEWNRAVTELMERLNKPVGKAKKPAKAKTRHPNPSPCMFCDKPMGNGAFHMIDITVNDDEFSSMKQGGWVHLQCLNAALHPKHMIQHWEFDDELLNLVMERIRAERDAD